MWVNIKDNNGNIFNVPYQSYLDLFSRQGYEIIKNQTSEAELTTELNVQKEEKNPNEQQPVLDENKTIQTYNAKVKVNVKKNAKVAQKPPYKS